MKRSRQFWRLVGLLYAVTWIGGYYSHQHNLFVDAQRRYNAAQVREQAEAAWYEQSGDAPHRRITRDGGPIAKVDWCFPILPGVLLVDSHYIIGPLYGRGGVSVVIYYGFGSVQIGPIVGWIS